MLTEYDGWNEFSRSAVNRPPEKQPAPPRWCADCREKLHPRRNALRCIPCAIAFDRAQHTAAPNTDACADSGDYGDCGLCGKAIIAPGVHFCHRQPRNIHKAVGPVLSGYTRKY